MGVMYCLSTNLNVSRTSMPYGPKVASSSSNDPNVLFPPPSRRSRRAPRFAAGPSSFSERTRTAVASASSRSASFGLDSSEGPPPRPAPTTTPVPPFVFPPRAVKRPPLPRRGFCSTLLCEKSTSHSTPRRLSAAAVSPPTTSTVNSTAPKVLVSIALPSSPRVAAASIASANAIAPRKPENQSIVAWLSGMGAPPPKSVNTASAHPTRANRKHLSVFDDPPKKPKRLPRRRAKALLTEEA
mmetsp:Transcript_14297/g.61234  ORF Transcript_14297/g.61234 Transcript_14297/m.61234 type:complete len:241 (+) Transcript_14297:1509-2231(+)